MSYYFWYCGRVKWAAPKNHLIWAIATPHREYIASLQIFMEDHHRDHERADQRTLIEGWAAKIERDSYGRRDEIAIRITRLSGTLYGHGLDLRTFEEDFFARTNTVFLYTRVFGFWLCSCY